MEKSVQHLITLFYIATVCIPAAALNKLVFALLLLLVLLRFANSPAQSYLVTWSPLVILPVFLYGLTLGLAANSDPGLARQLVFSVLILVLIYPIIWYQVDLDRAVKGAGLALCALTFLFLVAILNAGSSPWADGMIEFFAVYSLSAHGTRDFMGGPLFMFHLATSAFLFLPMLLFADDWLENGGWKNIAALLVIGAAIVASTSRGLILVTLVGLTVVAFARASNYRRITALTFLLPVTLLATVFMLTQTSIFSLNEFSNAIKIGHVASFFENMTFWNTLFGEGLATFYFTSGLGHEVAQTEITFMDQVRYFGVLLAPLVFLAIIFPSHRLRDYTGDSVRVTSFVIFAIYILLSFSNPVLFNSAGLSIVVWYWWRILRPAPPQVAQEAAPLTVKG